MERGLNSILFGDIGGKLKKVAAASCWWGAIAYIIAGIAMLIIGIDYADAYDEMPFIIWGIALIILGPIVSWLGSLVLYAFGKLVEDVEAIREKRPPTIKVEAITPKQPVPKTPQAVVKEEKVDSKKTPETLSNNIGVPLEQEQKQEEKEEPSEPLFCPHCGEDLAFMAWDDNDLKEKQTCPMCGKEILFNQ